MKRLVVALSFTAFLVLFPSLSLGVGVHAAGNNGNPDPGRPTIYMRTHDAHGSGNAGTSGNLYYHGGASDGSAGSVGVETGADKVYLVYWGSQWGSCSGTSCSNDPSGEIGIQYNFFRGVGGSSWNNSVTQYCEGVASNTYTCPSGSVHATNASGVYAGIWFDTSSSAPSRPSQSQLAGEATRAAAHFGNTSTASNTTAQYVINTATGNKARGFGTQYCAWHSSTSTSYGDIAYTNMPYITDAGTSCGANFSNLGGKAGITIVGGHEFAETESDIFPNGGWLDSSGSENGDKCAWISSGQGASANISLSTGTFPVQSLWSNAFNGGSGGCVLSY